MAGQSQRHTEAYAESHMESYKDSEEYKALYKRHKKLLDNGEIGLIEVLPVSTKSYGGFTVFDTFLRDRHKNPVLDMRNNQDGLGFGPQGAVFRLDKEDDLKYIYALYNCPLIQQRLVFDGQQYRRKDHQFKVVDNARVSEEYAETRQEDIKYQNKFYNDFKEDIVNFLCMVAGINHERSLQLKRMELCKLWDAGREGGQGSEAEIKRLKLKQMIDSPDMEYFRVAYKAISEGNASLHEGFYKNERAIYYYNDIMLGGSMEHVVSYLKNNDDVYVAFAKITAPKAAAKPE